MSNNTIEFIIYEKNELNYPAGGATYYNEVTRKREGKVMELKVTPSRMMMKVWEDIEEDKWREAEKKAETIMILSVEDLEDKIKENFPTIRKIFGSGIYIEIEDDVNVSTAIKLILALLP